MIVTTKDSRDPGGHEHQHDVPLLTADTADFATIDDLVKVEALA